MSKSKDLSAAIMTRRGTLRSDSTVGFNSLKEAEAMNAKRAVYNERRAAEPELPLHVKRDPTVYFYLNQYRKGRLSIVEAMAKALVAVCKEKSELIDAIMREHGRQPMLDAAQNGLSVVVGRKSLTDDEQRLIADAWTAGVSDTLSIGVDPGTPGGDRSVETPAGQPLTDRDRIRAACRAAMEKQP